jgi:CubicO group peptidase (beta-lactamase class C family)
VATAKGLARLYASLVSEVDGVRLLSPETIERARTCQLDAGVDRVLGVPVRWGLGFQLAGRGQTSAMLGPGSSGLGPTSFGHGGAGGSIGMADPESGMALAYVGNKMADRTSGSPASHLIEAVAKARA